MKKKLNFLWLIGVFMILLGLLVGLKINKVVGIVFTVLGMLIAIALILLDDKSK